MESTSHSAWLKDLPYYISMYKTGTASGYTPHITFWYRLNPGQSCSEDGTTCNTAAYQATLNPWKCDTDEIMFTVFTGATATVTVSIGGTPVATSTATAAGVFHSSVPFGASLGAVEISASMSDGTKLGPVTGPAISDNCDATGGIVNWNPWVGGS